MRLEYLRSMVVPCMIGVQISKVEPRGRQVNVVVAAM